MRLAVAILLPILPRMLFVTSWGRARLQQAPAGSRGFRPAVLQASAYSLTWLGAVI